MLSRSARVSPARITPGASSRTQRPAPARACPSCLLAPARVSPRPRPSCLPAPAHAPCSCAHQQTTIGLPRLGIRNGYCSHSSCFLMFFNFFFPIVFIPIHSQTYPFSPLVIFLEFLHFKHTLNTKMHLHTTSFHN